MLEFQTHYSTASRVITISKYNLKIISSYILIFIYMCNVMLAFLTCSDKKEIKSSSLKITVLNFNTVLKINMKNCLNRS
jgi:hypothetical protein